MHNSAVTSDAARQSKPAVQYLKLDEAGSTFLEGLRCASCNAIFVGARDTCSHCFSNDLTPVRLSDSGRLYNWTIVYRNFPGVPVPFVSAIVDLDGGGTVKGNLVDIDPDPTKIQFDMPVKLCIALSMRLMLRAIVTSAISLFPLKSFGVTVHDGRLHRRF